MSDGANDLSAKLHEEGRIAYHCGVLHDQCPYHRDSIAGCSWGYGWWRARREHTLYASAVRNGALAYTLGVPLEDCPYHPRTIQGEGWQHGWKATRGKWMEE